MDGKNSIMSKFMKLPSFLFGISRYQSTTSRVIFNKFSSEAATTFSTTLLSIVLLIIPSSDFARLMSLQAGVFAKLGLWFFNPRTTKLSYERSSEETP